MKEISTGVNFLSVFPYGYSLIHSERTGAPFFTLLTCKHVCLISMYFLLSELEFQTSFLNFIQ